jgi:two-component system nitrogen regulation response regulator GlnG
VDANETALVDVVERDEGGGSSLLETMGSSEVMRKVVSDIELVAPTAFTVLITGETGTGKEMVAQAIHRLSLRSGEPFVPVDCGAIPPTLIESELFGYEKGAYTGAERSQPGKFEMASGGTLFLDEISNLPAAVQPKLLRALQERRICRVGGRRPVDVDIRVIAATNQELDEMVQSGRFRMDLYHRLNEFSITVPPLCQRREDIVSYANYFLEVTREELNKDVTRFSQSALEVLLSYRWPGNVRELRNVTRQAVLRCDGCVVHAHHLGILPSLAGAPDGSSVPAARCDIGTPLRETLRQTVRQVEREIISKVMRETGGNKAKAARILQVDYKTIYSKVREYDITT